MTALFWTAPELWTGGIFAGLIGAGVWLYRKLLGPFICRVCGEPAIDRCMFCMKPGCPKHLDFEFDGYTYIPQCDACVVTTDKARKASV